MVLLGRKRMSFWKRAALNILYKKTLYVISESAFTSRQSSVDLETKKIKGKNKIFLRLRIGKAGYAYLHTHEYS